ncbi:thioredoxin family protein [Paenibacillus alvei]|uniref:thioredoxin family protein n=1 Tax=Paenibacillus alvei TaxID=44250 RepID=UPI00028828EC|nr:thioredoxin family protein [Paenibacillus alvei]EJW18752.1 thioredoxin-like protein YdfQ [Paenibacillus alvei DSM 29]MCY9539928.1 thioredoxin family protein [Paenibacillus alvei]MCY9707176.1 thioredoxin family protein [Paenibacillus alvei]MCY9733355.1 thioredoxin family protein [Paenibacillus alvei]MCY9753194.1 thioredoxin family protein [Paenibacillus alvei]
MREFEQLTSVESANEFIRSHRLSFLYITMTGCSVCHALQPQVQKLMMKYPDIHLATINAEEVPAVAGSFSVFTAPVLLLYVEGKEYIREARIVHLDLLDEKIRKIYDLVTGQFSDETVK